MEWLRYGGFVRLVQEARLDFATLALTVAGIMIMPITSGACPPASASSHPESRIASAPCGGRARRVKGTTPDGNRWFFNHYPDFVAMTNGGRIFMIETKGDDRDSRELVI